MFAQWVKVIVAPSLSWVPQSQSTGINTSEPKILTQVTTVRCFHLVSKKKEQLGLWSNLFPMDWYGFDQKNNPLRDRSR